MTAVARKPPSVSRVLLLVWLLWIPFALLGRVRLRALLQTVVLALFVAGVLAGGALKRFSEKFQRNQDAPRERIAIAFSVTVACLLLSVWIRALVAQRGRWSRSPQRAVRLALLVLSALSCAIATIVSLHCFLRALRDTGEMSPPPLSLLLFLYGVTILCTLILLLLPSEPSPSSRWFARSMSWMRVVSLGGLLYVTTRLALSFRR